MSTARRGPRRAALVATAVATAAGTTLLAGAPAAQAAGGPAGRQAHHRPGSALAAGPLGDLDAAAGPLDGASAAVAAVPTGRHSTVVVFAVAGIDRAAAGRRFGAHVHVGPCLPLQPAAALGHYTAGGPPSPATEVWLDVTVSASGRALAVTRVPFRIAAGARSVVVHAEPTAPTGAAGGRQACLPVEFR